MSKNPREVTNPVGSRFGSGPIRFKNETGGTLTRGALVYASGIDAASGLTNVVKADANAAGREAQWIVLSASVLNGGVGVLGKRCRLTGQNTNAVTSAEDPIYLSETAGGWTVTAPTAADSIVQILGWVEVKHASTGVVELRIPESPVQIGVNELPGTANALLDFSSLVLGASQNVIRGTSIIPTRASGYTAFTGTVTATPAQVYSDYRELHTAGVAEVLGIGSFPIADAAASIASQFAAQFISEVDPGATVLTAGGAPAIGIFALFAKVLLNGETFNSGGVAAAAFLSFQANVTDVKGEDTSMLNMEIASGGIRSVFKLGVTAAAGATHLFDFTDDIEPVIDDPTLYRDPNAATCDKGLVVRIGSTLYMIPLYVHD